MKRLNGRWRPIIVSAIASVTACSSSGEVSPGSSSVPFRSKRSQLTRSQNVMVSLIREQWSHETVCREASAVPALVVGISGGGRRGCADLPGDERGGRGTRLRALRGGNRSACSVRRRYSGQLGSPVAAPRRTFRL